MTIDKKYYLDGTEKVGDKVWSLEKYLETGDGNCSISEIDKSVFCLCIGNEYCYTKQGLIKNSNRIPSLFKSNPFIPELPKMMEVSDNKKYWVKKIVYYILEQEEGVITEQANYNYAREIQTKPKLSEILKEKGIDINNFENDL